MNSIDRLAAERHVLFAVVLEEFRVWYDKQRQAITPPTMEGCIEMWQESLKQ